MGLVKLMVLFVIFIFHTGCDSANEKKKSNGETEIKTDELILHTDTLINNCRIKFSIYEDSSSFVTGQSVNYQGEKETHNYPDRYVVLSLEKDKHVIIEKIVTKNLFQGFVHKNVRDYQLWNFWFSDRQKNLTRFYCSVCIPDTDNCHFFNLEINDNGTLSIIEDLD